ncbi:MAG: Trp biosynthesis-associated membrane protein [Propionibacteriaceae bacterium]
MTESEAPPARGGDLAKPSPLSRSRSVTFVCLLLGGLLAVVSSAQPWWRAAGTGAAVTFKGTEATGGLSQALAVVTLAGTLLVLVLKVRGRQVLAVLLVVAGLGVVIVGALRLRPTSEAVRDKIRTVSLIDQYALTSTAWPWVFAAAGVLGTIGAVTLFLGARHWPVRAERFERSGPTPLENVGDDPAGVWKALDAGLDPTTDAEPSDTPIPADPDVHNLGSGDTMGAKNVENHRNSGRTVQTGDRLDLEE